MVIVDDHEGFRRMARRLLEEDGFEVVCEAGDGEGELGAVEALRPQLVLLECSCPTRDGFVLASRLAASHPRRWSC